MELALFDTDDIQFVPTEALTAVELLRQSKREIPPIRVFDTLLRGVF